MTYVKAAKELPFLSNAEIDAKAREYGFSSEEGVGTHDNEKDTSSRGSSQGAKRENSQIV
jgi:hypothetical protein